MRFLLLLVLSLNQSYWTTITRYLPLFPLNNNANNSLVFDFPSGDTFQQAGSIDYLYYNFNHPPNVTQGFTASIQITTTGTPIFKYDTEDFNTCVYPATTRIFFWANNNSNREFDRWWSLDAYYILADGSITLNAPINDPSRWSSVLGKFGTYDSASLNGWRKALSRISSVGLTFGGGCFFGHGVYVSNGTAQFILQNYQVQ